MIRGCKNLDDSIRMHRRRALHAGCLSLYGLTLPKLLAAREQSSPPSGIGQSAFGKAKRCIFLFMWGGPAQQDTWDLKPDAPVEYRGEFRPIATNVPGIDICEHFPLLAQRADRLALIRSVTHRDVNHTTATHDLLTGRPFDPSTDPRRESPHLGSVLARLGRGNGPLPRTVNMMPTIPGDVPRFVEESRGQAAGWLGPVLDPLRLLDDPNRADFKFANYDLVDGLSLPRLGDRRKLAELVDQQARSIDRQAETQALTANYERAYNLLSAPGSLRAFRLDEEPGALRERYGRNAHGQCVLLARRLIEAGVPTTTVFWPNEGIKNVSVYWDTHRRNFIDLKTRLMPVSDQAFSTLLDDLQARGLLDETLVVWTGEFGRTPRVGQSVVGGAGAGADGRDHWPGVFTTVLAGAGIRGGTVYGASDRYAAYPAENPVAPADVFATVLFCLGVDPTTTLTDRLGRAIPICTGAPIRQVLA